MRETSPPGQRSTKPLPGASGDEPLRHDWQIGEVVDLLAEPFPDLLFRAQSVHRRYFNPRQVQLSTLVNIKSGACPEDCAYCPQSARYTTGVVAGPILPLEQLQTLAREALARGAGRFCMGAAWRNPRDRDIDRVVLMIRAVKEMGLETCATLGMLTRDQALRLKEAGLDFYNHNLDTSPEYYARIITTRSYQERLDTLEHVREAGIRVCCGGIIGMGESPQDRAGLLLMLANLPEHPESVPINRLVRVEGTPLADADTPDVDALDFVRVVAAARIMMPRSWVRLSAGRNEMSEALQGLCLLAGANSIFYGEKLLTTANPQVDADRRLLARLGMVPLSDAGGGGDAGGGARRESGHDAAC